MYVTKMPVTITGGILTAQNVEMLVSLGENALGCP